MDITLEKVEQVISRTGATYGEAKEALIASEGDVLDAIIYLESKKGFSEKSKKFKEEAFNSFEDLKQRINGIIEKGNVSRIVVKKEDRILVDVPVNAGVAVGVIALIWTPIILAIGFVTTVAFNLTFEITKEDGSVEVINAVIKKSMKDAQGVFNDLADNVKSKFDDMKSSIRKENDEKSDKYDENMYTYTVDFNDEDSDVNNDSNEDNKGE
ncbi:DUF4342 domain-containing protein [Alloiococcus sp. CFN-8]|uniref:DUF4342 domain-containing protein n=1 Tax=Alloiococcus sp. CFN-8 TaxID=3416081 RepID=UPI003CFB0657